MLYGRLLRIYFDLLPKNIENTINHSVHTVGMMHHFRKSIKVNFPPVFFVQLVPQFINLHLCHVFSLWSDHLLQILFCKITPVLLVVFLKHFLKLWPRLSLPRVWWYDTHESWEIQPTNALFVVFSDDVVRCLLCCVELLFQQGQLEIVWCQFAWTICVIKIKCLLYQNHIRLADCARYVQPGVELLIFLL